VAVVSEELEKWPENREVHERAESPRGEPLGPVFFWPFSFSRSVRLAATKISRLVSLSDRGNRGEGGGDGRTPSISISREGAKGAKGALSLSPMELAFRCRRAGEKTEA
jgi:hypothetical protein